MELQQYPHFMTSVICIHSTSEAPHLLDASGSFRRDSRMGGEGGGCSILAVGCSAARLSRRSSLTARNDEPRRYSRRRVAPRPQVFKDARRHHSTCEGVDAVVRSPGFATLQYYRVFFFFRYDVRLTLQHHSRKTIGWIDSLRQPHIQLVLSNNLRKQKRKSIGNKSF